ncbi:MAG: hypothetical protein ACYC3I_02380 [Gemmataceae bacterium]
MVRKGWLLLGLALSGLGCLSSGTRVEKESRQAPPVRMAEAPLPPAVTADQVTEANAADIAQALTREMNYDAQSELTAPSTAAPMANTMKP